MTVGAALCALDAAVKTSAAIPMRQIERRILLRIRVYSSLSCESDVGDRSRRGRRSPPPACASVYGVKVWTTTSWFAGVTPGFPRKSVHAPHALPGVAATCE